MQNTEIAQSVPVSNEKMPGFIEDFRASWGALRFKAFFIALLVSWLALFHFIGNSTLGYNSLSTPSLLDWMWRIYGFNHGEESHGKLIPFAVLALFWWKRKVLLAIPQKNWWPALFIVAFALGIHVVGFLVQQPRISIVSLFVGMYGLIGLTWGYKWLKASFFPFVLFVFCMPMGSYLESITFPLRMLATNITYFVTQDIFGLTVIKKGTQLFDAKGAYNYDVAAACSGIRSLIALLALTIIFAMMTFRKHWKRALVISMAVPLAVASNVLRLTAIVVAAEAFGQKAGDFVHEWSGFLTYAVALGVMLLMGKWLAEPDGDKIKNSETETVPATKPA